MDIEIDPVKIKNQIRHKINEYIRVLKISSKPDRDEFEMSAKITGAGIIIIGAIGFLFYLAAALIPQYL